MLKPARLLVLVLCLTVVFVAACDVEKQMDTMVDNPSFADPLFSKFMARAEYQTRAMDTILADPAMRQVLFERIAAEPDYARAQAEQLLANDTSKAMLAELMAPAAEPSAP